MANIPDNNTVYGNIKNILSQNNIKAIETKEGDNILRLEVYEPLTRADTALWIKVLLKGFSVRVSEMPNQDCIYIRIIN